MVVMKTMQRVLKFYIALLNSKVYSNNLSSIFTYTNMSACTSFMCVLQTVCFMKRALEQNFAWPHS
jgi:uncharacterized membrane protein required for colicin V production